MTEMKFHVTQEKHVLQSDECVFEMNTKKENVSRLTINHHILFTKTDNHVENHIEGQFPIKNTKLRTKSFYSTPFWGRVYKWKFCLFVHLFICLSVITSYLTDISVSVAQIKKK